MLAVENIEVVPAEVLLSKCGVKSFLIQAHSFPMPARPVIQKKHEQTYSIGHVPLTCAKTCIEGCAQLIYNGKKHSVTEQIRDECLSTL
jgi:hypothetical protein